jgi:hypothetical protein
MTDPFEEQLKRAFAQQAEVPAEPQFVAAVARGVQRRRRAQRMVLAVAVLVLALALAWLAPWVSTWFDLWVAPAPGRWPAVLHWVTTPLGAVLALATLGVAGALAYALRRQA